MLSSAAAVDKSEFFKTIAYASPLLEIKNGTGEFHIPRDAEMGG